MFPWIMCYRRKRLHLSWAGPHSTIRIEGFRGMYLFRCNFSSCSESTEIWHADSFVLLKCPCFFSRRHKNMDKIARSSTPPSLCPSPNNVGFRFLRAKTPCVCVILEEGGVVDFQECVWSLVYPLVEKKSGTFFNTKRVGMPNFNVKNCNEIGTYASLSTEPFNCSRWCYERWTIRANVAHSLGSTCFNRNV